MKRKNRTRTEVLLDIKTQADVKKILKTYKGAAEICIRYFGLGAGVCSLLYGAVHRPFERLAVELGILLLASGILIPLALAVRSEKALKKQLGSDCMELEYKYYEDFMEIYSRFRKTVKLSRIEYDEIVKMKKKSFGIAVQLKNKGTYYMFLNEEQQKQAWNIMNP